MRKRRWTKPLSSNIDYRFFGPDTWNSIFGDIEHHSYEYSRRHHGRKASLHTTVIKHELESARAKSARNGGHMPTVKYMNKMARKAIESGYNLYHNDVRRDKEREKAQQEKAKNEKKIREAEEKREREHRKKQELKRKRKDAARNRRQKQRQQRRVKQRVKRQQTKQQAKRPVARDHKTDEMYADVSLSDKIWSTIIAIVLAFVILYFGVKLLFHPIRTVTNTVLGIENIWYELFYSGNYSFLTAVWKGLLDGIVIALLLLVVLVAIGSMRGDGTYLQKVRFNLQAGMFTIIAIDAGVLVWVIFTIWNVNWFFKIVCLLLCIPGWWIITAINSTMYSRFQSILANHNQIDGSN